MLVLKFKYLFCSFLMLMLVAMARPGYAQLTESQAREMLEQKGISEDVLRDRLIKKGYDPDRIRPDQVDRFQIVVMETIREIEAENATSARPVNNASVQRDTTPAALPPIETPPIARQDVISLAEVAVRKQIYGQEIFRNNSILVFQKADAITPTDDYVLGTGDKLGVVGFGRSQFEQVLTIDSDGFVRPAGGLPVMLVKGLRFGDAKELLYQRFNQYYVITRANFQVTLTQPRNMTVNVFGEVRTPGAYTLPGFNTAFNVIAAAGGPTDIGSVRRIKVISGNQVRPLDVYEFMNNPGVAKDFFLQSNDYIHIPVAEKVVTIEGAVTRPMSYELLEKENLTQLIAFAGGVRADAYMADVKVTRFLDDRQVITNVNYRELSAGGGDYILYDGDIVEIKTIESNVFNFVTVTGAVQFPGPFERRAEMRVSDLLDQSKLMPEARLDYAYLLKYQPDGTFRYRRINLQSIINNPASEDNVVLGDRDQLEILALNTFVDLSSFSVSGSVRRPDMFQFDPAGQIQLEDAILLAGGLSIDAADHGYIMRFDPSEPKTMEYIHIDLREAFDNPASDANIDIKAGDQIIVYDKSVIRDAFTVSIFGAVRNPGEYPYGPEMTLADLVNLAGGLRFGADYERIDIARTEFASGKDLKTTQYTAQLPADFNLNQSAAGSIDLQPFDHVYVRNIPEFEMQQIVQLQGEVRYPGDYAILQDNERISDLIERAGGLTGEAFPEGAKMYRYGDSTGLVVINLAEILANESVSSNVALLAGDVIDIPKSRDLVTIGGFVNLSDAYADGFLRGENSISVAYMGPRSAKYYIDNFAAGISDDGAGSEVKVQYPNGRVKKTKKFLFFNNYPEVERGSIITVGPKEIKPIVEKEQEKIDWGTVLKDTLTQATAVLTILILVDQLGK